MSFLTPFYIAGLLAIAAPIVFHLIRRTPKGRKTFSTLMFLRPSPPRISRRSYIDDWLLLLLRALALCVLAFAFARPFMRIVSETSFDAGTGRRVVVLIDTSASMRRGDLWRQANTRVKKIIEDTNAADELAFLTFDRDTQQMMSFREWNSLAAGVRDSVIAKRIEETRPGWGATQLDAALIAAAGAFDDSLEANRQGTPHVRPKEIIVVSDLQAGSRLEALEQFAWSDEVQVVLERVTPTARTNAALHLMSADEDTEIGVADGPLRVRVSNAGDSTRERFRVGWQTDAGTSQPRQMMDVYVAPGQSRIIQVPAAPSGANTSSLVLLGDEQNFDNRVYLQRPKSEEITLLYFGGSESDDPEETLYYLRRALPTTGLRKVTVLPQAEDSPFFTPAFGEIPLVVVSTALKPERVESLKSYVRSGGTLLLLPSDATIDSTVDALFAGESSIPQLTEATVDNYVMFADIDFTHPVFASLAEARFADFTGIHVWRYRNIDLEADESQRVLARFDSGAPALVELPMGKGKVFLSAIDWKPADSQLPLSSKFVPLMNGLLEYSWGRPARQHRYVVGDSVTLDRAVAQRDVPMRIQLPDRNEVVLASHEVSFGNTLIPGIYVAQSDASPMRFAVNLSPEESRTEPLKLERLEALGVAIKGAKNKVTPEQQARDWRQLRAQELEHRQQMWRWLIVFVICVLVLETWIAGRKALRQSAV